MGIFSKLFNLNVKSDYEENTTLNNVSYKPASTNMSGDFLMIIEDVFTITGRGTVVTGCVSEGEIRVGDNVSINGSLTTTVAGIEQFRTKKDYAVAGENIGLLLSNISRNDIHRGDRITK